MVAKKPTFLPAYVILVTVVTVITVVKVVTVVTEVTIHKKKFFTKNLKR